MSGAAEKAPVNWVVSKHNCRIERVLDELFAQVQADITERGKLNNLTPGVEIRVDDSRKEQRAFSVARVSSSPCYGEKELDSVRFACEKDDRQDFIQVTMESETLLLSRIWDSDLGECQWFLDKKRVEPWQVSERSLTNILLGS